MIVQAQGDRAIGTGEFQREKGLVRSNISLRQDKSTGTFGPYVLDDVGISQEPSTWSRSSKFNLSREINGLIGTLSPLACRHAA